MSSGTQAAAHGGYTTVCAMPNLDPVPDSLPHLEQQLALIRRDAAIRVLPYGSITRGQLGEELSDMAAMAPYVAAFSDDGRGVQSEAQMRLAMETAKGLHKLIVAHCEDNSLLHGGYIHDGAYARTHGHRGICSESEWGQIRRDLELVRQTGCGYHVCHISTKESVALIRRAKAEGLDVTCETAPHYLLMDETMLQEDGRFKMNPPLRSPADREALLEVDHARKRGQTVYVETCPQYLLLDESVYFNEDYSAAARYVCAPPLRDKAEQEYLWKGLRRGAIQTVSTDHCSFTLAQKDMGREDFTKIPGGLPGVETRGELMYSYGVARRKISAAQMCRVLSENHARLYGLYPRKGVLRPGSDADIVVYDPGASHVIRAEDCVANVDYNPYEGFVTAGGIRQVWLRGRLSVEDGKVLAEAPAGKYMARGKNSL